MTGPVVYDYIQGSPAWVAGKLGKVSASGASQILTPGSGPRMPRAWRKTKSAPNAVKRAPRQNEILDFMADWVVMLETEPHSTSALRGLIAAGHIVETEAPEGTLPIIEPLKLSDQRGAYMNRLLAEWATGSRQDDFGGNRYTEHGMDFEGEALDAFALITGETARAVGWIEQDDLGMVGASPDWIGADFTQLKWWADAFVVEVKCPAARTHIRWLLDTGHATMPVQHVPQVQFQMWVIGCPRAFFVSYAAPMRDEPWRPGASLPPIIAEVEPDPRWQDALSEHVPTFVREMLAARAELIDAGVTTGEESAP